MKYSKPNAIDHRHLADSHFGLVRSCRAILGTIGVVSLWSTAIAATPAITSTSGVLTHGSLLTISGTGFGTKASGQAAPVKFDDFEDGTLGESVVSKGWWNAELPYDNKTYDNTSIATRKGVSTQHIRWHSYGWAAPEGQMAGTFGKGGLGFESTHKAFLNLWANLDFIDGTPEFGPGTACQLKWITLLSDGPQPWGDSSYYRHESEPSVRLYLWTKDFVHTSNLHMTTEKGYLEPSIGSPEVFPTEHHWFNVSLLYKESSDFGTKDGAARVYFSRTPETDGVYGRAERNNMQTRAVGDNGPIHSVVLGYLSTQGFHEVNSYWDDIYIDNSWARVELGDSPIYDSCRHREIQICSTWTDKSIRFKANQGGFDPGTAYLFVLDEENHPSAGFPVTIGGPMDVHGRARHPARSRKPEAAFNGQGKRLRTTASPGVELSSGGSSTIEGIRKPVQAAGN